MPLPARRRAFTLIELLIVIGVIAILVGLVLAVTARVTNSGRESKTLDAIKVLTNSLTEYVAATGGIPGATVVDPRRTNPGNTGGRMIVHPVADAYTPDGAGGTFNSVGLYMVQCDAQPSVRKIFETLDAKFMRELDQDGNAAWDLFPPLRTVFDAWDRPIRYVHPAWDGLLQTGSGSPTPVMASSIVSPPTGTGYFSPNLQIRRSNATGAADADAGICRGGQPYFYSAGPDGDPSTVADNVYLAKPEIEKN